LLLALVAAVASGLLTAPAHAATADDQVRAAEKALAAMQDKANKAQASLEAGTRALEAGEKKLANLERTAAKTQAESKQAEAQLKVRREQVSAYAASVYRNAAPNELSGLFVLDSVGTSSGGATDVLKAAGYLDHVSRSQADVLRQVRVDGQRAEVLRKQADQLVQAAAEEKKALDRQVKQLQDQAARDAAEVDKAVKAYEAAKAEAERQARERAAREAARKAAAAKAAAEKAAAEARARASQATRARQPGAPAPVAPVPTFTGSSCSATNVSGYPNGMLPDSALCALASAPGHRLRADAAAAFDRMSAAYAQAFGSPICVTDSYRSYAAQVDVYRRKPSLAAIPGRSNHGWGLAADLCGGIQNFGSAQHRWMKANAPKFGWFHPGWAEPNGSKPEPWHWEFGRIS
jgi:peptidoglycan hydrolase CwlO-like protein